MMSHFHNIAKKEILVPPFGKWKGEIEGTYLASGAQVLTATEFGLLPPPPDSAIDLFYKMG